jgi:5-hydroxyisourate hydrolase
MGKITTHVLDTSLGKPAENILVTLSNLQGNTWVELAKNHTNADGRVLPCLKDNIGGGTYRLDFALSDYFERHKKNVFYPSASIVFEVADPEQHYHIPLLLSGYGYSTYKGS